MRRWNDEADDAIRTGGLAEMAPGLEGYPRVDAGAFETSLPSLLDALLRGPVVLTRQGRDAFVLLPADIWQRVWAAAPRPPVVEGSADAPKPKRSRKRGKA